MTTKCAGRKGIRLLSAALLGSSALVAVPAAAQSWQGTHSTDWEDPANWSTGMVPADIQTATIDTTVPNKAVLDGAQRLVGGVAIGEDATGTLTISGAAALTTSNNNVIGDHAGSNGTLIVTGAGSTFFDSGNLGPIGSPPTTIVGNSGTGAVSVQAGGKFTDSDLLIGNFASGVGVVTVTGAGSILTVGDLRAARLGTGAVIVGNGGEIDTTTVDIGSGAGSYGTVIVSGTGSKIATKNIIVGTDGKGTLNVEAGAVVSGSGDIFLAAGTSPDAEVAIDGGGAELDARNVIVGSVGDAFLAVKNGGALKASGTTMIGVVDGSAGVMTVDGAGSYFETQQLLEGANGASNGSLTIGNGGVGRVIADLSIGVKPNAEGDVVVTDAGSDLLVGTHAVIGDQGRGNLTLSNGAQANAADTLLGNQAGSVGVLNVDGAAYIGGSSTIVGNSGSGAITLTGGGAVQAGDVGVGLQGTGVGSIDVGDNATFTARGNVSLGQDGAGTIAVHDGGTFDVAANGVPGAGLITVAIDANSTGIIQIGGQGNVQLAPGTLNVAKVQFGAGVGVLSFDLLGGSNYNFDPILSGASPAGASVVVAAGTVTLTADSSGFGGETFVQASYGKDATLNISGKLGGSVLVGDSGLTKRSVLTGSGTLLGDVVIKDSGTLLGKTGTTLTMGSLELDPGAHVDALLDTAGAPPVFDVTGNLTLDGTLDIINLLSFGQGVYRLFDYGGTLTDHGMDFGTIPAGTAAGDLSIQTSVGGQVNLVYLPNGGGNPGGGGNGGPYLFWDGDATGNAANAKVDGGAGNWTATSTNFTNTAGTANGAYDPTGIFFSGQAGIVTTSNAAGQIHVDDIQFMVDGYRLQGDPLSLGQNAIVAVGDGSAASAGYVATISNALIGTGGLKKDQAGTLILNGDSSYTGGTTIADGTLQIGSGGASGSIVGDVDNQGILAFDRSDTYTFDGTVSGAGMLRQNGDGRTVLTAGQTYTGATDIEKGTLALAGNGNVASSGGVVIAGGATFDISGLATGTSVVDLAGAGTVALGGNTLTVTSASSDFDGSIQGAGSLHVAAGALGLNGVNTYSGGTTIDAGAVLILNDGGTGGSMAGDVVDDGTFDIGRPDDYTFAGTISGTGVLLQGGAGVLTLAAANSYSGGTDIEGGGLRGTTVSLQGQILDNTHLIFDQAGNGTFAGLIGGSGDLTKNGGGTVTFANAEVYAGTTTVNGGGLVVLGGLPNSDVTVAAGFLGGYGPVKSLTVTGGTLVPGQSPGTMTVLGNATLGANSTYAVDLAGGGVSDLLLAGGKVTLNGGTLALNGPGQFGVSYRIIGAQGGVTGTFGTVTGGASQPFMTTLVDYQPDAVFVTTGLNGPAVIGAALTRNERAAAHGVVDLPLASPVTAAIASLDPSTAPAAFDQLSGEIHAGLRGAIVEDARATGDRLLEAIGTRRGLWGEATVGSRRVNGDGNAATVRGSVRSILFGIDGGGDKARAGVTVGYGWDDVDVAGRGSSARMEALRVGGYVVAEPGRGVELKAAGLYSRWRGDVSRTIAFAGYDDRLAGRDRTDMMQAMVEAGWKAHVGQAVLQPFGSLDWVGLAAAAIDEHGGAAALTGRARRQDSWFGTLGLRASAAISSGSVTIVPKASLAWERAFGDRLPTADLAFAASTTGSAYPVSGPVAPRDRANAELGVDVTGRAVDVGLSAGGSYADRTAQTSIKLHLRWQF